MKLKKKYRQFFKMFILLFFSLISYSCSAVINDVLNDNKFSDGDYFFVMYKSYENSISAYGTMSIYFVSYDSTISGSYIAEYNKYNVLSNSKGGIIGKSNQTSGEVNLKFGSSYYSDLDIKLSKNIDVISGEWSSGYSSGKIFAFRKK